MKVEELTNEQLIDEFQLMTEETYYQPGEPRKTKGFYIDQLRDELKNRLDYGNRCANILDMCDIIF